ncbi:MAG: hypothetical protein BGO10_00245 [Chlamydia sp. 32-24]|nr:MAG: hypothetical protein BGO10_00245 [Chlamydia sp. 32-24]
MEVNNNNFSVQPALNKEELNKEYSNSVKVLERLSKEYFLPSQLDPNQSVNAFKSFFSSKPTENDFIKSKDIVATAVDVITDQIKKGQKELDPKLQQTIEKAAAFVKTLQEKYTTRSASDSLFVMFSKLKYEKLQDAAAESVKHKGPPVFKKSQALPNAVAVKEINEELKGYLSKIIPLNDADLDILGILFKNVPGFYDRMKTLLEIVNFQKEKNRELINEGQIPKLDSEIAGDFTGQLIMMFTDSTILYEEKIKASIQALAPKAEVFKDIVNKSPAEVIPSRLIQITNAINEKASPINLQVDEDFFFLGIMGNAVSKEQIKNYYNASDFGTYHNYINYLKSLDSLVTDVKQLQVKDEKENTDELLTDAKKELALEKNRPEKVMQRSWEVYYLPYIFEQVQILKKQGLSLEEIFAKIEQLPVKKDRNEYTNFSVAWKEVHSRKDSLGRDIFVSGIRYIALEQGVNEEDKTKEIVEVPLNLQTLGDLNYEETEAVLNFVEMLGKKFGDYQEFVEKYAMQAKGYDTEFKPIEDEPDMQKVWGKIEELKLDKNKVIELAVKYQYLLNIGLYNAFIKL